MSWRSRTLLCTVAVAGVAFVAWVLHDWPTQPTTERSVRRLVDAAGVQLPVAESAEELTSGYGPILFVLRQHDGSLQLHELSREDGDRRFAARVELPLPWVDERGNGADSCSLVRVRSAEGGHVLCRADEIGGDDAPDAERSQSVTRAAWPELLAALRKPARDAPRAETPGWTSELLLLQVDSRTTMQGLVDVAVVARAAGFQEVSVVSPLRGRGEPPRGDLRLFQDLCAHDDLPAKCGWGPMRSRDVEVLVAADGNVAYGELEQLVGMLGRSEFWNVGYACRTPEGRLAKVPMRDPRRVGR